MFAHELRFQTSVCSDKHQCPNAQQNFSWWQVHWYSSQWCGIHCKLSRRVLQQTDLGNLGRNLVRKSTKKTPHICNCYLKSRCQCSTWSNDPMYVIQCDRLLWIYQGIQQLVVIIETLIVNTNFPNSCHSEGYAICQHLKAWKLNYVICTSKLHILTLSSFLQSVKNCRSSYFYLHKFYNSDLPTNTNYISVMASVVT